MTAERRFKRARIAPNVPLHTDGTCNLCGARDLSFPPCGDPIVFDPEDSPPGRKLEGRVILIEDTWLYLCEGCYRKARSEDDAERKAIRVAVQLLTGDQ